VYAGPVDPTMALEQLSVRELRQLLRERGFSDAGLIEKAEMVALLRHPSACGPRPTNGLDACSHGMVTSVRRCSSDPGFVEAGAEPVACAGTQGFPASPAHKASSAVSSGDPDKREESRSSDCMDSKVRSSSCGGPPLADGISPPDAPVSHTLSAEVPGESPWLATEPWQRRDRQNARISRRQRQPPPLHEGATSPETPQWPQAEAWQQAWPQSSAPGVKEWPNGGWPSVWSSSIAPSTGPESAWPPSPDSVIPTPNGGSNASTPHGPPAHVLQESVDLLGLSEGMEKGSVC